MDVLFILLVWGGVLVWVMSMYMNMTLFYIILLEGVIMVVSLVLSFSQSLGVMSFLVLVISAGILCVYISVFALFFRHSSSFSSIF